MPKFCVTTTSAVSEPRTAVTAATTFPRFHNGATNTAFGPDGRRRRDCEMNRKTLSSQCLDIQLHVIDLELTFAGRHAIGPPVIDIFAAKSSAVLEPSTARSAATDSD